MSETSEVTRPAIEAINALPYCHAHRVHSGKVPVRGGWMHLGPEGMPDICVTIRGCTLYIETKAPVGGRVSDAQLKMHARLRVTGARVEVVRSVPEALTVVRQMLGVSAPGAVQTSARERGPGLDRAGESVARASKQGQRP